MAIMESSGQTTDPGKQRRIKAAIPGSLPTTRQLAVDVGELVHVGGTGEGPESGQAPAPARQRITDDAPDLDALTSRRNDAPIPLPQGLE